MLRPQGALIKRADPADPLAVVDLEREAAVLRGLAEPGVPKLVEVIPPSSLLVLEDDGGEPLCFQIAIRPLAVPAFLALARSLTETLCRLHRAGLIHRGLAPSAVLFEEAKGRVRLLDFAFASRIREGNWTARPARLLGARIAYASPEQTGRMSRIIDHRSDLYSLGALLYHALCGAPPFQSDDPLEMVHAHIARIPLAPAAVVPGLPEPISDIVMKLLSKEAEDRYQGAAGLLADWDECAVRLGYGAGDPEQRRGSRPSSVSPGTARRARSTSVAPAALRVRTRTRDAPRHLRRIGGRGRSMDARGRILRSRQDGIGSRAPQARGAAARNLSHRQVRPIGDGYPLQRLDSRVSGPRSADSRRAERAGRRGERVAPRGTERGPARRLRRHSRARRSGRAPRGPAGGRAHGIGEPLSSCVPAPSRPGSPGNRGTPLEGASLRNRTRSPA